MARCILVVGAGKSTSYLLDYLLDKTREERLKIIIADKNPEGIPEKLHTHPDTQVIGLDVADQAARSAQVAQADLSLIHISEPTRRTIPSRMPSSA